MIQIDIKMPKCCDECFALDDHGDYPFCLISRDQRGYTFNAKEKRMPTCPLKAQEPCVMTLEEVHSCENAMWIELFGGKGFYAFVLDRMKNGILEISTRAAYLRYYSKDYNVKWRCWTSRPNEKRRAETPWN